MEIGPVQRVEQMDFGEMNANFGLISVYILAVLVDRFFFKMKQSLNKHASKYIKMLLTGRLDLRQRIKA